MPVYSITCSFADNQEFDHVSKTVARVCKTYDNIFELHTWLVKYQGSAAALLSEFKGFLKNADNRILILPVVGEASWAGRYFDDMGAMFPEITRGHRPE
jgi:hypothetical protein